MAAPDAPNLIAQRQQQIHAAGEIPQGESRDRAHEGGTHLLGDIAIGPAPFLDIAAHRSLQLFQRGSVLQASRHHGNMGVVEDEHVIVEMSEPVFRQSLPALADIDPGKLQAPQQGSGIDQIEKGGRRPGPDMLVIDIQHLVQAAAFDKEKGQMPPMMDRQRWRCLPVGLKPLEPGNALVLPPFHFQHMGHGMDGPGIRRADLDRPAARHLGSAIIPAFLQPEGMHAKDVAVKVVAGGKGGQHAGRGVAQIGGIAQIEICVMGEAKRPDVPGVIDENFFPDRRGTADLAIAPGLEGGCMTALPGR